jgi:hypothetical protein
MPKWKYVMCCALFIYCIGLIFFGLYPTSHIDTGEWFVVIFASIAALGLVAYATPGVSLPYEEYAYLVTGWAGFSALLLYLVDTDDPSLRRTGIALFLMAGSTAAYGAFLAQDDTQARRL